MKHLQRIAASAFVATALLVIAGPGSASATTIEVEGVKQNQSVQIRLRVSIATSAVLSRTDGSLANKCKTSLIQTSTEKDEGGLGDYSGPSVTGVVSSLAFTECERAVTVHKAGILHISHNAGTTNGTVSSSGAEVTVGSPFGTLNCKTGSGVDIGTLTGSSGGIISSITELHVNAVLNCGFLVPSATWIGTYEPTFGEAVGVVA